MQNSRLTRLVPRVKGMAKGWAPKLFDDMVLMWRTYLPSQQTDPSLWGLLCEWPLSFDAPLAEVELPLHPILMVWEIPPLWTSWSTCFAHIWPRAKHQEMRGQKCQKLRWPVSSSADSRLWLDHTCVRTAYPIPLHQLLATVPRQLCLAMLYL